MRSTRFRAALALAAIVGVVAAGCAKSNPTGGGGTSAPPSTGACGVTKDATIAAEVPSSIASKGSVTVASDASYPPMEFFAPDHKTVEGADVDIGTAVGDVLGIKFNFVNATFDGIIPGLQSGKYDVGWSSFFDTKEREKVVDMVDYFQAGSGIFVKAGNSNSYTSLSQFCGQAVAAESGTTELDDAKAASKKCPAGKSIKALSFSDQNGVNLAVISGRAIAGLADTEVALYQTKVTNGQLRFAGEYAAAVLYGIAVPRAKGAATGSGPMTKPILDALKKLYDSGVYAKILQKWGIQKGALTAPGMNQATS